MVIKNLKLKIFLVNRVFPIFSFINKNISHNNNTVFFYCNLSFRDNNRAVYDYMIKEGYNKKYRIIVASSDYRKYINNAPYNVSFVSPLKTVFSYFKSKWIIYCIGKIPIELAKDQTSIYMNHGMPFKDGSEGEYKQSQLFNKYFTYMLSTGEAFVNSIKHIYGLSKEKIVYGGNPKCDLLFLPSPNYDFGVYDKLILWVPTFRQSSSMKMNDVSCESSLLPILNTKDFNEIDRFLKKIKVKIIVKLHPEQDLSKYRMVSFDNFVLLSHQEFVHRKMDINRFMTQADAMITDYSSIFYDYLLLNRPIGFTEDDIKQYAGTRGFAVDPNKFRPGFKIKTKDDIFKFAIMLANGIDDYKNERKTVNDKVNLFKNGGFSKHILEVIGIKK